MDKTNYSYVKVSAGLIFTLCMMLCVMSCDRIDNPIRYGGSGGKITPTVQQVVETVVNVTGANPSDVSAALGAIVTNEAVAAAAAKGEPIKVTVAGSGVSTDATDQTITIPQANGANIEISFATAPTTSNTNPLEFTASSGAAAASGSATNILAIEMPTTTGLVITIELPKTTVVLATNGAGAVTYNKITAKTATNTLIVNNGITIKDLTVEGGNVVIQGGKIDNVTIAENQDITFTYDGSSTENMTIGAGASVRFNPYQSEDIYEENHPKIKTIIGDEGKTAKFYLPRFDRGPKPGEVPAEEVWEKYGNRLKGIEKISNCKVLVEEGDVTKGTDFTNVIFDNCELNGNNYLEGLYYNLQSLEWPEGNTITFNNCTFNFNAMGFMSPNLNEDHSTATLEFNNCTFKEGINIYQFAQWANAVINQNYTITFKFTNCKLGTADITSSNFVSNGPENPGLIPGWALIEEPRYVEDQDLGGGYFIHAIYQIGEDKYVWKNVSETEEPNWQLKAYTPPV